MARSVQETVKVGFAKTMEDLFRKLRLPFFKAGSRRFGYGCEASDTDFFVLCAENSEGMIRSFESAGFLRRRGEPYYPITEGRHILMVLPGILHIAVLYDKDRFEEIRQQHERIECLLNERPNFKQVATDMRNMGLKGAYVFRVLDSIARSL